MLALLALGVGVAGLIVLGIELSQTHGDGYHGRYYGNPPVSEYQNGGN